MSQSAPSSEVIPLLCSSRLKSRRVSNFETRGTNRRKREREREREETSTTTTLNSKDLERERCFALADKIKQDDINKLPKQKLTFPQKIMEAIWMTQNFHAIISLCFGNKSHSALFLESWADHMYKHRLMYKSLQATDPSFFLRSYLQLIALFRFTGDLAVTPQTAIQLMIKFF